MIVPTKASSKIVNSILQLNRAIQELISADDLKEVLTGILNDLNAVLLDQIKVKLVINNKRAFDMLSDELDFLLENFKEFFFEQHKLSVESLLDNVELIKRGKLKSEFKD